MKKVFSLKKSAVAVRRWRDRRVREARRIGAARCERLSGVPITASLPQGWTPPAGCSAYSIRKVARKWLPRPRMGTLEWLKQNAMVPGRASDFKGRFNVDYFPYEAGVLEMFDDPEVREIYLQWGTQLGKTFLLKMLVPKVADTDPAPIVFACADSDQAQSTGEGLYKIIEQIERLKKILPVEARRDSFKIDLGDCVVNMAWSGSPASLGDKSCRYVLCIELSKWNLKKSQEADPADLVRERVKMYFNTKIIMEGTPTIEGICRMDALRVNANQRMRFQLPCPHCGRFQILAESAKDFRNFKWEKRKDGIHDRDLAERTTWYECIHCKKKIDNSEKIGMMRRGVWAEAGVKIPENFKGKVYYTPGKYKTRIHTQLSSLYSPLLSWGACASEFIRCTDKNAGNIGLQNFVNSWLAEPWSPKVREYRWEDLKKTISAAENKGVVPPWVRFLTAGVDVMKGWGVYVIRGWGPQGRSRLIAWGQITSMGELEAMLFERKFQQEGKSEPIGVALAGIDTGYQPYGIYLWSKEVNQRRGECVRCIKGHDNGAPYWMTVIDRSGLDGKAIPGGVQLWNINDHFWKSFLVSKYEIPAGRPASWEVPADVDEVYMRSITGEVLQERKDKRTGKLKREWHVVDTTIGNDFMDAEKIAACMADMCGWDETEEQAVRPERRENTQAARDDRDEGAGFLDGSESFLGG